MLGQAKVFRGHEFLWSYLEAGEKSDCSRKKSDRLTELGIAVARCQGSERRDFEPSGENEETCWHPGVLCPSNMMNVPYLLN
jgi:hypothetical protein